jgi:hypothetical protein
MSGDSLIFLQVVILAGSLIILLSCSSTSYITPAKRTRVLPVMTGAEPPDRLVAKDALYLVSINLAHGRKDSLNQILVSAEQIREILDLIAAFLMECDADVVALQEADSSLPWNGGFDHVSYSRLYNNEMGFILQSEALMENLLQKFEALKAQSYLWGSLEWLTMREKIRASGEPKAKWTKKQRKTFKRLHSSGLKWLF